MPEALIPLLCEGAENAPVMYNAGTVITRDQLLSEINELGQHLPNKPYIVNLCENRYHFLLALSAVMVQGRSNILPPSKQPESIASIASEYPEHAFIVDSDRYNDLPGSLDIRKVELKQASGEQVVPAIPAKQIAAIAFTSGSTGKPRPNVKTWGMLAGTATRLAQRFNTLSTVHNVIATVPSQHMYGLEMTALMSLQGNCALTTSHPFYPQDIADALATIDPPRMLVTTPIHLRALLGSNIPLPEIEAIISATAPLPQDSARQAEQKYACKVEEIYGCTEGGSLATRRTLASQKWQPLSGVKLEKVGAKHYVTAAHLPEAVELQDRIELAEDDAFILLGRSDDILNVGGKRASLADLNHKLQSIAGIDDAVVFLPKAEFTDKQRPAAFFVSSTLGESEARKLLELKIDPVFLPRPLHKLKVLPRNEAGKLPYSILISTLKGCRNESK